MDDNFIVPISRQSNQSNTPPPQSKKEATTYPTEIIDLPSGGHFYPTGHPLSSGNIEMKLMTAKEEDILMNQNLIKKGIVLDKLIENLIVDKSIKIDDILLCDKNALYIAARRLAYGDSYGPVEVKCQKCGETNQPTINLAEIKIKDLDLSKFPNGENKFEYTLPYSKKTITFKLLTHNDDKLIDGELKTSAKLYKNNGSVELTTRLKYIITSVDGNEDKAEIRKFVENELTSRDSLSLRTYIKEISPEVDSSFNFVCEHCGAEERMGIPITVSFFWPNSTV
jgi:hypothetical protein